MSGNYQYVSDSSGLLTVYEYGASTTATSSAGDVEGYLKSVSIKHGESGTAISQESLQYVARTVDDNTIYEQATDTVYRNDDGSGAITTSTAYTWQGSTFQAASTTVTLPTIGSSQNGPNSAATVTTFYDAYGRPTWSQDADGFLSYVAYDPATGAVVKTISDVDTTQTTTFTGKPTGWTTPTGGGLHLTTTMEVDALGRTTKLTDPNGNVTYTVYKDADHEVRVYAGWTGSATTGPTTVVREDRGNKYAETLTMTATPNVSSGKPTGTESIGNVQTLTRQYVNNAGQVVNTDAYFNLSGLTYSTSASLGTAGTNLYRSAYTWGDHGELKRVLSPTGTLTRQVVDGLGRVTSVWVGTNDTPASGYWSPTNNGGSSNMVKVEERQYDNGGIGVGNLTKVTVIPGGSAANQVTEYYYDWRKRLVATKQGVETTESTSVNRPIAYMTYDNLDNVIKVEQFDGDGVTISSTGEVPNAPSSSLRRAQVATLYDDLGRAYKTLTYSVDQSNGTVSSNALTSEAWFDKRGNVIKTSEPGGLVTKSVYDGVGRATTVYVGDGYNDSTWTNAGSVSDDNVLEQTEYSYDANSNVIETTVRQRFHDETTAGALGTPSSGVHARVSYSANYYDAINRPTASVAIGTNGGSAWTRPSSVPSRSDTVLVTSYSFNAAGWVEDVTDPKGIVFRQTYDALARVTKQVEAYTDGTPSTNDDKTVEFTYDAAGHMLTLKAWQTGGAYEETQWVYGVTTSGGSTINSNDLLAEVRYPNKSTGAASSSEKETYTVNALGQTLTFHDRNGSTHTFAYDVLGRQTSDAVTTLGTGVDGAVRRLETAYDNFGQAYLFTSYSADSGGTIVNQVQRERNGLGQLITEYQSHSAAVDTSTTPKVQYAYTEMSGGANHSRLTSMTYPDGKVLTYNYGSGLNDRISRISSLSDTTGTLESYEYLGLSTVVLRAHPQPGVDLTYIKQSSESNGDAGDLYNGLDRFGRVVLHRWIATATTTVLDGFGYGYDRDGNRLYRENLVNATFSELYGYDSLNQLTSFDRGTLNGGKTAISGSPTSSQSWSLDALGNFSSVT